MARRNEISPCFSSYPVQPSLVYCVLLYKRNNIPQMPIDRQTGRGGLLVSQQEFFQQSDKEEQQAPYYQTGSASRGSRKGGVPKDVPVEDDDFAMLHSYRAQAYGEQDAPSLFEQEHQQARGEQGQGVPPWARPQKNNSRRVVLALLIVGGLLLIKPLLIVAGILLAVLGATIGVALVIGIFVLALLAIIVGFALLALRITFGRAFQPRHFYDRRYWRRYRRGLRW